MNIITRDAWGARPPRGRIIGDTIFETYTHHSVGYGQGGAPYMRTMQDQHMDTKGWDDIAYNFVIDPKTLTVFEGRGWGVRPGAQKSHNTGTWAVCIMGHFSKWTPAMFPGLLELIAELIVFGHDLGHIPLELTGGHRDAPGSEGTTCPGTHLYAALPTIRQLLEESMALSQEDKDWILTAIRGDNIEQTESVWTRYAIRDTAGNLVPLVKALEFIYRQLQGGVDVNASDILSQINLKQAS